MHIKIIPGYKFHKRYISTLSYFYLFLKLYYLIKWAELNILFINEEPMMKNYLIFKPNSNKSSMKSNLLDGKTKGTIFKFKINSKTD